MKIQIRTSEGKIVRLIQVSEILVMTEEEDVIAAAQDIDGAVHVGHALEQQFSQILSRIGKDLKPPKVRIIG